MFFRHLVLRTRSLLRDQYIWVPTIGGERGAPLPRVLRHQTLSDQEGYDVLPLRYVLRRPEDPSIFTSMRGWGVGWKGKVGHPTVKVEIHFDR